MNRSLLLIVGPLAGRPADPHRREGLVSRGADFAAGVAEVCAILDRCLGPS
jgi:hypothetical protein